MGRETNKEVRDKDYSEKAVRDDDSEKAVPPDTAESLSVKK